MFNGPYMIQDVEHVITPGTFETTLTGVRQGMFDLPAIDSFLQSINKNLLSKIEQAVLNKKDEAPNPAVATTDNGKAAKIVQEAAATTAAQNSCTAKLNPIYSEQGWVTDVAQTTSLSEKEFKDAIVQKTTNTILQTIIYCICYVRTHQTGPKTSAFVGVNNNFASVTLDLDYGNNNIYFTQAQKKYACLDVAKTNSTTKTTPNVLPIANFENVGRFIDFMISKLQPNLTRITQMGLTKYYVCYWPLTNLTEQYYDTNKDKEFTTVQATFEKAIKSANSLGLPDLDGVYSVTPVVSPSISATPGLTPTATSPSTPTPTPTKGTVPPPTPTPTPCPKPIISSFTPTLGGENTILTIKGKQLDSITAVTFNNNVNVINGLIKSKDGTQIIVTVPKISIATTQGIQITVKGQFDNATSSSKFTYNPATTTTNAPAIPTDTSKASLQTQKEISTSTSSTRQDGQTGSKVLLETETNGLKGMEKLVISINPETTGWRLNSQADLKLQLVTNKKGPNNTQIQSKSDIKKTALPGYVTDNLQEFEINNLEVINIALDYFTQEELNAASYLNGQVDVIAISANSGNPQTYYTASLVIYFNT